MKKDLISIIVPIYNVEQYLKKCVDSLVNQTYKNIEILLIDDGSTDSSGKIADELANKDDRIKVFHKKNGGLSDARNYGIEKASGKYLSFIDSDDYVSYKMMEILHKNIIDNNCDVSICSYLEFLNEDEIFNDYNNEKIMLYNSEEAIKCLFSDCSFGNFAWNKLYKKELFDEIRYPKGYKMEDIGTTYKIFYKSKKIVYSDFKLYYYFQRQNSILHKIDNKLMQDKFDLEYERYVFINNVYADMIESKYYFFKNGVMLYPYISKEMQEKFNKEFKKFRFIKYKKSLTIKDTLRFVLFKFFKKLYCKLKKGD